MSFLYKLHMKVIGSTCISISYGTEQSIVQQIPPLDDEVYTHIYTQLLPLDRIEGDPRHSVQGKCFV